MVFTINWDETDPATTKVAFPTGATDIQSKAAQIRERLNTILTDGTLPAAPPTLANYDARIPTPGPGLGNDPLRIRGDRVDLRGYTVRSAAPISRAAINTTAVVGFNNATGLQITMTPVSSSSIIEFHLMALAHAYNAAGAFSHAALTRYGAVRIFNTTAAAALIGEFRLPVGNGQSGGANNGTYDWMTLRSRVTGLTGANVFDVQISVGDAQTTLDLHGDLTPSLFWYIEHV